jgi:hypothetical protein
LVEALTQRLAERQHATDSCWRIGLLESVASVDRIGLSWSYFIVPHEPLMLNVRRDMIPRWTLFTSKRLSWATSRGDCTLIQRLPRVNM